MSQIVLITGANGGLGNMVTQSFLDAGAAVIGVSRKIQDSDFPSPNFTAMPADLCSGQAAAALISKAIARFGRIDVVAHLAGGFAPGADDAALDRMLDVNFKSAVYLMRAVVPHMRQTGSGRLIAIGSRMALEPSAGVAAYSASKAALVSFMRTIALENRDTGLAANVVLPSTIDTPANRQAMPKADFSQWVDPRDIAALICHLASDRGAAINGAAIPIYGRGL